jgi:type I restriction enzyme R subunit
MISFITESVLELLVLELLDAEGWSVVHGPDIAPGETASERSDYRDVVLVDRLKIAIEELNPLLSTDSVDEVIKTVLRAESQDSMSENWRAYQFLIQGVPVQYRNPGGVTRDVRAHLIDWSNPENNNWAAINQFTIYGDKDVNKKGDLKNRRPDVMLFVNGLPLALLELKRPGHENASLRGAFNQIQTYKSQIPDAFTWNQITVISDGVQSRAATHSAGWEHYAPWKTIDGTEVVEGRISQAEVMIRGMFTKDRFLDLIRNFVVYAGDAGNLEKKVAKYHQYWAVNKAVASTVEAVEVDGRAGVVWHTQGSGKSLEMEWYAGKIMRHPAMENPTIIVLTDRNDLDDQLFDDTFAASRPGAPLPESPVQATSRNDLKNLLSKRQSGGIIFSTIQKFGLSKEERDAGTSYPTLSERMNIVVMVDEAHRSNYDFIDGFARHLRDGLPNATFIGFTGTPIESKDKSTRQVFGEYIDVYDLTQAVADGATVKVYYEPRLAKIDLPREALGQLDDAFAMATSGTEEEAKERLKSRWAQIEAIIGSDKRIKELAVDIVDHWEKRREALAGKAMIVAMSRRIAAQMYEEIVALRPQWASSDDATGKIKVVITGSAADEANLQPHIRSKDGLRALKSRAKDPSDELEIVIVRDMWLTGFDSPSMHTMYVDKPMRGANLMQAIARVNRTFKDKPAGLVVDYLGIAEDLKSALADYTVRDQQKQELGQDLRLAAIPAMISKHEVVATILHEYKWREQLAEGGAKAFLNTLTGTVEYLLSEHAGVGKDECTSDGRCTKCRFLAHTRDLVILYTMCVPSDEAMALRNDVAFFEAIRGQISKIEGSDREGGDPSAILDTAIKQIVSEAMSGTGVIDIYEEAGLAKPDISLIDDKFVEKFKGSKNPNLQIELLKRILSQEIGRVGKRNIVTGRAFSEMLGQSILRYQNRTLDAAQVVAELVALAKALQEEGERGSKLGLNSDELAFYDAVCANSSAVLELSDEVLKKIAHELVEIVRRDAKTDWAVKEQVRAKLRSTIKRLLLKYGYPPDLEPAATQLVLEQAEVIAGEGDYVAL